MKATWKKHLMKIHKIRKKQGPLGLIINNIKKNLSKFNKSIGYEQILKPWLYNFIVTRLWGI
jgi:hypothetical protein